MLDCSDKLPWRTTERRSCRRVRKTSTILKNRCDNQLGEALGASPRANRCKHAIGDDANKNVSAFCTNTCMKCGKFTRIKVRYGIEQ